MSEIPSQGELLKRLLKGVELLFKRAKFDVFRIIDIETVGFVSQTLGGAGQKGARLLSPGIEMTAQTAVPPVLISFTDIVRGGGLKTTTYLIPGGSLLAEEFYRAHKINLPSEAWQKLLGDIAAPVSDLAQQLKGAEQRVLEAKHRFTGIRRSQAVWRALRERTQIEQQLGSRTETMRRAEVARRILQEQTQPGAYISSRLLEQLKQAKLYGEVTIPGPFGRGEHTIKIIPAERWHEELKQAFRNKTIALFGYNLNFDLSAGKSAGFDAQYLGDLLRALRQSLPRVMPDSFWKNQYRGSYSLGSIVEDIVANFNEYEADLDPRVRRAILDSFGEFIYKYQQLGGLHASFVDTNVTTNVASFLGYLTEINRGVAHTVDAIFRFRSEGGGRLFKATELAGFQIKAISEAFKTDTGYYKRLATIDELNSALSERYGSRFAERFTKFFETAQGLTGNRFSVLLGKRGELMMGVEGYWSSFVNLPAQVISETAASGLLQRGRSIAFARRVRYSTSAGKYITITATELFYEALERRMKSSLAFTEESAAMLPDIISAVEKTVIRPKAGVLPELRIKDVLEAGWLGEERRARFLAAIGYSKSAFEILPPEMWGQLEVNPLRVPGVLSLHLQLGLIREEQFKAMRTPKVSEFATAERKLFEELERTYREMGVKYVAGSHKAEIYQKGIGPVAGMEEYIPQLAEERPATKGLYQYANVAIRPADVLRYSSTLPYKLPFERAIRELAEYNFTKERLNLLVGDVDALVGSKVSSTAFGTTLFVLDVPVKEMGDTGAFYLGVSPKIIGQAKIPYPASPIEIKASSAEELLTYIQRLFIDNEQQAQRFLEDLFAAKGPVRVSRPFDRIRKRLESLKDKVAEDLRNRFRPWWRHEGFLTRIQVTESAGAYTLKVWGEYAEKKYKDPSRAALLGLNLGRVQITRSIAAQAEGIVIGPDLFEAIGPLGVKYAHLAYLAHKLKVIKEFPEYAPGPEELPGAIAQLEAAISSHGEKVRFTKLLPPGYRPSEAWKNRKLTGKDIVRLLGEGVPAEALSARELSIEAALGATVLGEGFKSGTELEAVLGTKKRDRYIKPIPELFGPYFESKPTGRAFFGVPAMFRIDVSAGPLRYGEPKGTTGISVVQFHQTRTQAKILGFKRPEDYYFYKQLKQIARSKGYVLRSGPGLRLLRKGPLSQLRLLLKALGRPVSELPEGRVFEAIEGIPQIVTLKGKRYVVPQVGDITGMATEGTILARELSGKTWFLPLKEPISIPLRPGESDVRAAVLYALPLPSAVVGGWRPGDWVEASRDSWLGRTLALYWASWEGGNVEEAAQRWAEALQDFLTGKESRFTEMTTLPLRGGQAAVGTVPYAREKALWKRIVTALESQGSPYIPPEEQGIASEAFMRRSDILDLVSTAPDWLRRKMTKALKEKGYIWATVQANPAQRPMYARTYRIWAIDSDMFRTQADFISQPAGRTSPTGRTIWLRAANIAAVDRDNDADVLQVYLPNEWNEKAFAEAAKRQASIMGRLEEAILDYRYGRISDTVSELLAKAKESEIGMREIGDLWTFVSTKATAHLGYSARARLFLAQLALSGQTMESTAAQLARLGGGKEWSTDVLRVIWEQPDARKKLLEAEEALKIYYQVFVQKAGSMKDRLQAAIGRLHQMVGEEFQTTEQAVRTATEILRDVFVQGGYGEKLEITPELAKDLGLKSVAIDIEQEGRTSKQIAEDLANAVIERLGWLMGVTTRMMQKQGYTKPTAATIEFTRGEGTSLWNALAAMGLLPEEGMERIITDATTKRSAEEVSRATEEGLLPRASRFMTSAWELGKQLLSRPAVQWGLAIAGGLGIYKALFGGEDEMEPPGIPIPEPILRESPSMPREPLLTQAPMDMPPIKPPMPQPTAYLQPVTSPVPSFDVSARTKYPDGDALLFQSTESMGTAPGSLTVVRYEDDREVVSPYRLNEMVNSFARSRWVT